MDIKYRIGLRSIPQLSLSLYPCKTLNPGSTVSAECLWVSVIKGALSLDSGVHASDIAGE